MQEENITSYCLGKYKYNEREWTKQYKEYLQWLSDKPIDPYCDPDGKAAKATEYYDNLTTFLSEQEKNKQEGLNGTWRYAFIYGTEGTANNDTYGIAVYDENDELLFFLKSDQFGFSAPSVDANHIYDIYLENMEDKKAALDDITKWILNTRTLGGGLLWPMEKNDDKWNQSPPINLARGGSIRHRSYIEDRIDLTLWEIKRYLDCEEKENYGTNYQYDILCKCMQKCPNLKKWMDHFANFEAYVKFFCFEDFCEKSVDTYEPLNLMSDQIIGEDYDKNNKELSIYYSKDFCKNTKTMLETLSSKIIVRTKKMIAIINAKEKNSRE